MTKESQDLALETLLAARESEGIDLSEEFVIACFQIATRFQFSKDRADATAQFENLIMEAAKRGSGA